MTPRGRRELTLIVAPSLVIIFALWIIASLGLDLRIADSFYSAPMGGFPARHDYLLEQVLHHGGDRVIIVVGVMAMMLALLSLIRPRWHKYRRPAVLVVVAMGVTTGLVAVAKHLTNVDCPWALTRYGGDRPYVPLFADRPDALPRGECFPGAHSAGAFSLMSVALLCRRRRYSIAVLAGAIALGAGFAFVQWLRGAHFVSHDLCSAWCAWIVCFGCHRLICPIDDALVDEIGTG